MRRVRGASPQFGLLQGGHSKLPRVDEDFKRTERAQNLWTSFLRSVDPMARGAKLTANPGFGFESIGGLAGPKDEVLVATKGGLTRRGRRWLPAGSPEALIAACDASLTALGVDPKRIYECY